MSTISLAYQPTFIYQVDPLLNISPLIDLYSNCVTHVVDTDGQCHLQDHKSPIVLSYKRGILNSSLAYQPSLSGVRSSRCLLIIAALFISWNYDLKTFVNYIIPTSYNSLQAPNIPAGNYARIYPQFFIILSNQSASALDQLTSTVVCQDELSPFFTLRLNPDPKSFPRIFGEVKQRALDNLAFNCSTYPSCRDEIELLVPVLAKFIHDSWRFNSFGSSNGASGHPFQRGSQAGIEEAMESFVLGPRSQRVYLPGQCPPSFQQNYNFVEPPKELIPTGGTAVVKFVTTAGVFTPRSSYRVYFSPFLPTVWLSIAAAAGITVATMFGVFRMQGEVKVGLARLTLELGTWIFAAAIGQYKHSGIPLTSGSLRKGMTWIIAPLVVSWFVLSTFLVNVYSAVFNSDATRSFYYLTNYTEFLQLPHDTLTYVLENESYIRRYQAQNTNEDCSVGLRTEFCYFHKYVPASCTIDAAIYQNVYRLSVAIESIIAGAAGSDWKASHYELNNKYLKMEDLSSKSSALCATTKSLSRILQDTKKPLAFLINDHDFPKYWQLFVQVMQSNTNIKVANNFDTDDSFLSEQVTFEFTSGLHPAAKGSVVTRMKILLSSGIYGLWRKWHRIKFTDGGLQHAEKKLPQENKVDPVSFVNSGTLWVFQAQAYFWLVAAGIFVFERIILRAFTCS